MGMSSKRLCCAGTAAALSVDAMQPVFQKKPESGKLRLGSEPGAIYVAFLRRFAEKYAWEPSRLSMASTRTMSRPPSTS